MGVEQDVKEGIRLLKLASDWGHVEAHLQLAALYQDGIKGLEYGVDYDEKDIIHFLKLAAEGGNAGAQFNLGMKYATDSWLSKIKKSLFDCGNLGLPKGSWSVNIS